MHSKSGPTQDTEATMFTTHRALEQSRTVAVIHLLMTGGPFRHSSFHEHLPLPFAFSLLHNLSLLSAALARLSAALALLKRITSSGIYLTAPLHLRLRTTYFCKPLEEYCRATVTSLQNSLAKAGNAKVVAIAADSMTFFILLLSLCGSQKAARLQSLSET